MADVYLSAANEYLKFAKNAFPSSFKAFALLIFSSKVRLLLSTSSVIALGASIDVYFSPKRMIIRQNSVVVVLMFDGEGGVVKIMTNELCGHFERVVIGKLIEFFTVKLSCNVQTYTLDLIH